MKKEIKYLENAVEYTENKKSTDWKTKQKRLMLVSNCASCCKKKSKFINKEEARRLDFHWVIFNGWYSNLMQLFCFSKIWHD